MWTRKANCILSFAIGAFVGGITVWRFAEEKYRRIADEEIRSVKETYSKRESSAKREDKPILSETDGEPEKDMKDYTSRLQNVGYLPKDDNDEKNENDQVEVPYVISPSEFGEYDGYEQISLTYYSDGVLTDENYEIVESADEIVGQNFYKHFGEYEDDSVFIRNDRLRCDYEILQDPRPYSEIVNSRPYLRREK